MCKLPYVDPKRMMLGERSPKYIIRVGREWTKFYLIAAEAKWRDVGIQFGSTRRWFGGMVTEAAFYVHLREQGKWKHWWGTVFFGEKEEAGDDFITSHEGALETIGIRSREHKVMKKFADTGSEGMIFYPLRQREVPRYIISTSYKTVCYEEQAEESTLIAFWGAITGSDMAKKLGTYSRYNDGSNPCILVPLREWDAGLLDEIVRTRDSEAPDAFKKLKESWGGQGGNAAARR